MKYTFVPATDEHAKSIAARCRKADVEEFLAASGETPLEVLRSGMRYCPAMVCMAGKLPLAMFGVTRVSLLGSLGIPWMVGTVDLDRHALWVLRRCKPVLESMLNEYETLINFIDCRNKKAIKWLKWMGFDFGEPKPYGVAGLPFYRFERRR